MIATASGSLDQSVASWAQMPLEEIGGRKMIERAVVRGFGFSERKPDALRAAGCEQLLLVDDRTEQSGERIGEERDALDLQLIADLEERDLGFLQATHYVVGAAQIALDRIGNDLPMIEQRVERGRRHRVDGIGTDDALDVHQVGVVRILGRGGGPQRPLNRAAFGLQRGELFAFEDFFELLIGELQTGDSRLAEQVVELFAFRDAILQELVNGGVDAADEDGVHRPNFVDGFALVERVAATL